LHCRNSGRRKTAPAPCRRAHTAPPPGPERAAIEDVCFRATPFVVPNCAVPRSVPGSAVPILETQYTTARPVPASPPVGPGYQDIADKSVGFAVNSFIGAG